MVPVKSHRAPDLLQDGFPVFSTQATQVLNKLVNEQDVTIMLTTSHKANYSLPEWVNIFKARGIQVTNIQSLPENIHHLTRKEEITNWFNLHNISEDFVIIDDCKSLNDLVPYLKNHLVLTSAMVGLTMYHLPEIINIINSSEKLLQ
ncbi:hypothetical protein FLA_2238 [Filimonas lacunae]|nr:hypothetical protein FLA_2238 [Filimonas lacunae]